MRRLERTRCLVTGASGPVGSALVRILLADGCEVAAMARPESDLWRLQDVLDRVTILRGELSKIDALEEALLAFAPESVFHLAWEGSTRRRRNDAVHIDVNVPGSLRLLEICSRGGARTWTGAGSQAEYGARDGILDESHPANPQDAYGLAKLCVGRLAVARGRSAGIAVSWLRVFSTFGPADDSRRFVPSLIETMLEGGCGRVRSGGQLWDYLYVEDAARAFSCAAAAGIAGTYNLASGSSIPLGQVAEQVRNLIDPLLPLDVNPGAQDADLLASISRLGEATGWRPETSLDEGLRQTVDWYKGRQRLERGALAEGGGL